MLAFSKSQFVLYRRLVVGDGRCRGICRCSGCGTDCRGHRAKPNLARRIISYDYYKKSLLTSKLRRTIA